MLVWWRGNCDFRARDCEEVRLKLWTGMAYPATEAQKASESEHRRARNIEIISKFVSLSADSFV